MVENITRHTIAIIDGLRPCTQYIIRYFSGSICSLGGLFSISVPLKEGSKSLSDLAIETRYVFLVKICTHICVAGEAGEVRCES